MKKLHLFVNALPGRRAIRTRALIVIAASLAGVFWFLSGPSGLAGAPPPTCFVCHRRTDTVELLCNSLDYQRHLDHGDPMGPCPGTPPSKEDGSTKQ